MPSSLALEPGSLIFVSGVNGLIGSHIADQLLARGYRVRGAVRSVDRTAWLAEYFAAKYPDVGFALAGVPDMTAEGCYDDVVKGSACSLFPILTYPS